jgi:hypothetical protein
MLRPDVSIHRKEVLHGDDSQGGSAKIRRNETSQRCHEGQGKARRAQAALEVAAHDAGLTLRRNARKLKRTAQKLETNPSYPVTAISADAPFTIT